jgi:hypothetical protein
MPIENGITQSVTDMRGETSLQEPIESGWNLVCLVSLVFLLRIPGVFKPLDYFEQVCYLRARFVER